MRTFNNGSDGPKRGAADHMRGLKEKRGVIGAVAAWQKTIWYPIVFALLGVLSSSFGWHVYVPVFYLMALSVVFAALFCDDVKVMLVPLLMAYYAIGSDKGLSIDVSRGDVLGAFELPGLVNMLVAGGIMFAAVAVRLSREGVLRIALKKRGRLAGGFACMAAAFMLAGAFSPEWEPINLAYGLLMAIGLGAMYFIVLAAGDRTSGLVRYVCELCVVLGVMISAEAWILIARAASGGVLLKTENGNFTGSIDREVLVLGWGEANLIAGTLVALIPPVMYFAYSGRPSVMPHVAALFMYATIVVLNARTSMLIGLIVLAACIGLCCVGKNKSTNRMMSLVILAMAAFGVIIMFSVIGFDNVPGFLANVFRLDQGDNQRFERWADGMRDFAGAPVFGVGFADGAVADAVKDANMYSNMYHNIGVQLFGAMGLVGVAAFVWHIKGVVEICVRRFRVDRLLIMLGALSVIMTSFLDNFFFYLNVQLIYGALLAVSEKSLEETRAELLAEHKRVPAGRKPRVVFTFVEAGMGHIVPETAVCDAFERKYGDRTEVVRSHFYTETGDGDMARFESGFVDTVMMQSRSKVFGKLCMFGCDMAGAALSQRFVMRMRGSGRRADNAAVRHMRDLDADVIFTTHWATAYYASRMAGEDGKRPYTMMLCPDSYSNGMFDMDCDDFLIPTEAGLARTEKRRMYAGGHCSVVPYPIRSEAFALRGKKAELRRAAGIGEDEFVAVLADGGYGMAKLEQTVHELLALKADIRILAVCGKNAECAARLREIEVYGPTRLNVYDYADNMLELVCMSDIFVGKSGANSMAEPTFFGLPIIITKCITPIESNTKRYYTRVVGNAMYIPDPKKAAQTIVRLAADPAELGKYTLAAEMQAGDYGAEKLADLIYERVAGLVEPQSDTEYKVVNYSLRGA